MLGSGGYAHRRRSVGSLAAVSTVLVVDDESDIRELVRLNLELDGHDVILASDGNEALEFAVGEHARLRRARRDDAGEVDGWEVLAEIKASIDPVIAEIPVLMLTARADDIDRIRGGIEGALRYLTKPFSPSELRDEVRAALVGDPEPMKRRKVQTDALEHLARLESGTAEPVGARAPRSPPDPTGAPPDPEPPPRRRAGCRPSRCSACPTSSASSCAMVSSTPTVSEAAQRSAVSRSNVYASLRRIARKLDVRSVPELVTMVRGGALPAEG